MSRRRMNGSGRQLPRRNESQSIVFTRDAPVGIGAPVSGSFRFVFAGESTSLIQFDATAAAVKAALEALPNIGDGDLTVSGSMPAASLGVVFGGSLANTNVPLLTVSDNTLENDMGTTFTAVITTVIEGSPNEL